MANQYRAANPPRPSTHGNDFAFGGDGVGVLQLGHVPAGVGTFLDMRDAGMMRRVRVRRTCRSRFRKRGGGQTKDQKQIKEAFQKMSVHRVLSPRDHNFKDNTSPAPAGTKVSVTRPEPAPPGKIHSLTNLIKPYFDIKSVRISIFQRKSWLCPYHNWVQNGNDRARCANVGRFGGS